MKLIIQIPCYNEEKTLPVTFADLPEKIPGIDEIETLVINDGSTDSTLEVAREQGVDHILDLGINKGLANAWAMGLEACIVAGAGIIVNTDGDNQYCGQDIPKLVQPILDREAEIVIGARPIEDIGHFPGIKKRLQRFGSWVVSRCAGIYVEDAASGFRAYSTDAAREFIAGKKTQASSKN
ncbi:MAG: glycosyltransferase family 2 protein [Candidatus Brocadiia bacterium]